MATTRKPNRGDGQRPRRVTTLVLAAVLIAAIGLAAGRAAALVACTAADIIAQSGSDCPAGSGACTIKKDFDIAHGCTLDFGARDVTVANGSILDPGSGAVTFRARNFTVAAGGYIDARGNSAAPNDIGGFVHIETSEAIVVLKQSSLTGRIDAGGTSAGGTIQLNAGTTVTIAGRLSVDGLAALSPGGAIHIVAAGDVTTAAGSTISGFSGNGGSGGAFEVQSQGSIDLGDTITLNGADGGSFDVSALGAATVRGVNANGNLTAVLLDPGSGGSVAVDAGGAVQLLGAISATGRTDGCGGDVSVSAAGGDITVAQSISVSSGLPIEGGGSGNISLVAQGTLTLQSGGSVSARADGRYAYAGGICLDGVLGVSVNAPVDASGGGCGGLVAVLSSGNVSFAARVDAAGTGAAGVGGTISACAGFDGQGSLMISNTVSVAGGPCGVEDGCGAAGSVNLEACDLTIAAGGLVDGRAPDGGAVLFLRAHEQLTNHGSLNALASSGGFDGEILLSHRLEKPPLGSGTVKPAATDTAHPTCVELNTPAGCLDPCPSCGNGAVEYPETCDMAGTPVNCDGCTRFCRNESCEDDNDCTIDSCDALLGCIHVLNPPCNTPTPTVTRTETPAGPTATRTRTHTSTLTPTITNTGTVTLTPSITLTPTQSPTATDTPTRTLTATVTATRTASLTPTVTGTATPSVTPTHTTTQTPTAATTVTPTGGATLTPGSTHDTMIVPPRPLTVRLRPGASSVAVTLKVKVRNADILPKAAVPGHVVRLSASDGTCPAGTVAGLPDLERRSSGAQDSATIAGGRAKAATVPLSIASAAFTSFNLDSPARCAIVLTADAIIAGNVDPSPANNTVAVEINVTDSNDAEQTAVHQSHVASSAPARLKIRSGRPSASKAVTVKAGNGDASDPSGHAITLLAADGDCPPGTVGVVDFDSAAAGAQPLVAVNGGSTRSGSLMVTVYAADLLSPNKKSPARCTAWLHAVGPAGDADASNDVSSLVIDIVDQNDF